jgi:arylsulfatase
MILLADDLGFSDLGCYGGEINTPQLDRLAAGGLRFTQFYSTSRCWPTRAALLTGYYAQQVRRDTVPGVASGVLGKRPSWATLLPERLHRFGYRAYHSGKWHLDGQPMHAGFDRSYCLDDHDRHFTPQQHQRDGVPLPAVGDQDEYYSTDAIAQHAIECLAEHAVGHSTAPFFSFVAFTAPHFPLQAPTSDIDRYRTTYQAGWDRMRVERWKRLREQGLVVGELSQIERALGPPYAFPLAIKQLGPQELDRPLAWDELTSAQQKFQSQKMAVHAAMVDRMDREIGRVLEQIRRIGAWDNTLILFFSDNGASAEIMVRGDGHDPRADCGTGATFLSIGPGWSSLANAPFRRHKTWVHEGGIASPLIVHWPVGISARGELRHTPCHVIDLVPTITELVIGASSDGQADQLTVPLPGSSLVRCFATDPVGTDRSIWWFHEGNRALRHGRWKIVAAAGKPWELYDLALDRAEVRNLAQQFPAQVQTLVQDWEARLTRYQSDALRELEPATEAQREEHAH